MTGITFNFLKIKDNIKITFNINFNDDFSRNDIEFIFPLQINLLEQFNSKEFELTDLNKNKIILGELLLTFYQEQLEDCGILKDYYFDIQNNFVEELCSFIIKNSCDVYLAKNGILKIKYDLDNIYKTMKKNIINYDFNTSSRKSWAIRYFSELDSIKKSVEILSKYYYKMNFKKELISSNLMLIRYDNKTTRKLELHTDDSELTVNLCFENSTTNNEIIFKGYIWNTYFPIKIKHTEDIKVVPEKNTIIIHRGIHPHKVNELKNGIRENLIMWLN